MKNLQFNPNDEAFIKDPHPLLKQFREQQPIHRSGFGFTLITKYDDAMEVLKSPVCGHRFLDMIRKTQGKARAETLVYQFMSKQVPFSDPPHHTKMRKFLAKSFSPPRLKLLKEKVQSNVNRQIDEVMSLGSMDIMERLAYPIPTSAVSDLLGIPEEDRQVFQNDNDTGENRILSPGRVSDEELSRVCEGLEKMITSYQALLQKKRANPGDDLISDMIVEMDKHGAFSEDELIPNLAMLYTAGVETTSLQIGNVVLSLYRHPQALEKVRADRNLVGSMIDEAIRYEPAANYTFRTPLQAFTVAGERIEKGEVLLIALASANRDKDVFDDPDAFNIERTNTERKNAKPLTFGGGPFYCVGAQLAKLEISIILETLFDRIPGMNVDVRHCNWTYNNNLRGLKQLYASW